MPRIDAYIDKALKLMDEPKADRRRVLLAFAESIAMNVRKAIPPPAAMLKCPGCGREAALCGACAVKQTVGSIALDALGLGNLPGLDGRAPPRDLGRLRGTPQPQRRR